MCLDKRDLPSWDPTQMARLLQAKMHTATIKAPEKPVAGMASEEAHDTDDSGWGSWGGSSCDEAEAAPAACEAEAALDSFAPNPAPCPGPGTARVVPLTKANIAELRGKPVFADQEVTRKFMFVHFAPPCAYDCTPRASSAPGSLFGDDSYSEWLHFVQVGWNGGTSPDGSPRNLFKAHVAELGCVFKNSNYTYAVRAPRGRMPWLKQQLKSIACAVNAVRPELAGSHAERRNKRTRVRFLHDYRVEYEDSDDEGWQGLRALFSAQ